MWTGIARLRARKDARRRRRRRARLASRTVAALGLAAVVVLALLGALRLRRFLGAALEGYPETPADGGVVMAGSISSTVKLDYETGVAEKTYNHATRVVRLLYRLSFQAPFPYTSNRDALEAAQHRRTIAGLLTQHWFGENLVAQVLEVRPVPGGGYTLVTELVPGGPPTPGPRARAMLRALTARFLEAGLPSWQVGYYNPRAIGNLIERADGSYRIIDLESNFVTPFLPPAATIRAIRIGQFPSFDDIDVGRLRAYLDAHREAIKGDLSAAEVTRLDAAVEAYAEAAGRWHAGEPRLPGRALRLAFRAVDLPAWLRAARAGAGRPR
jgi:hypothetical protein